MKCLFIVIVTVVLLAPSAQDKPLDQESNEQLEQDEPYDLTKFNESLEIDIVATHDPKPIPTPLPGLGNEVDQVTQKLADKLEESAVDDSHNIDSKADVPISDEEVNIGVGDVSKTQITDVNSSEEERNNESSVEIEDSNSSSKAAEEDIKNEPPQEHLHVEDLTTATSKSSEEVEIIFNSKEHVAENVSGSNEDPEEASGIGDQNINQTVIVNNISGHPDVISNSNQSPVGEDNKSNSSLELELNASETAASVEMSAPEVLGDTTQETVKEEAPEVDDIQSTEQEVSHSEVHDKNSTSSSDQESPRSTNEQKMLSSSDEQMSRDYLVNGEKSGKLEEESHPNLSVNELSEPSSKSPEQDAASIIMDEFTREFSEKYRKSLEADPVIFSLESSTETVLKEINLESSTDGHCPDGGNHCIFPEKDDRNAYQEAGKPDQLIDQPVTVAPVEENLPEVDIQLVEPTQVNEDVSIDVNVETDSNDTVFTVKEIGMVNSEIVIDDVHGDNATSNSEIGDPLGDVYFGILKEYLCKIEVVFEKTPRATLMTLVVGVLYIIFVTLKMVLRKKSKESQLSAELSNLQSVIHKYSVERSHYNKLLTAERQKTQSIEETMNEMNDEYRSYQESLDKIKSERKLFEHECARLKSKLAEQQELVTKTRCDHELMLEENVRLKARLGDSTTELESLKTAHVEIKSDLSSALSKIQDLESTSEELLKDKNDLLEECQSLRSELDQVSVERDDLIETKKELVTEINTLQADLKRKTEELTTLLNSVEELEAIKGSEDPGKEMHDVMDLVGIRVKLSSLTEESENLKRKVEESEEERRHLEEELTVLKEKSLKSEEVSAKAVEERNEAVKNLEVLTKYFKEREVEMQKELGAQQIRNMQKEENASSLEERLRDSELEKESYKSQCESMRKELAESERSFKSQLAAIEKRAHDSWVAARNFERELVEMKNVAAFLRQKLTETAKSSHSLDASNVVNGADHSSMFQYMPPPPPPPGPLPPSMDFMNSSHRPSSSASGSWDLGPMPPPPPMPPLAMPFMPGMPMPLFNPHPSYSDYSNRLSPSSRHSHSPAYSYSADALNGDQSLDYSSLNFSQSMQPPQQPEAQQHQQNQVQQQQRAIQGHHQQQQQYYHHDQSNC